LQEREPTKTKFFQGTGNFYWAISQVHQKNSVALTNFPDLAITDSAFDAVLI
jgi:hypothetical protein